MNFRDACFLCNRRKFADWSCGKIENAARDVSLTLEYQSDTSILNIFLAIVDQILPEGNSQVMVRLIPGGIPVLPRITQKSVALIDLKAVKQVFAQVKSFALLN